LTLSDLVDSVAPRRWSRKALLSRQGTNADGLLHRKPGACRELRLLENGREDERQCGQRVDTTPGSPRRRCLSISWPIPIGHKHNVAGLAGSSSKAGPKSPRRQEHGTHSRTRFTFRVPGSHTNRFDQPLRWVVEPVLDGEFDPGSGRTLAACLTHASRTRSMQSQDCGRPSGERVRNT
jgi:hypothetical protein